MPAATLRILSNRPPSSDWVSAKSTFPEEATHRLYLLILPEALVRFFQQGSVELCIERQPADGRADDH
jgi:hypothetical protein